MDPLSSGPDLDCQVPRLGVAGCGDTGDPLVEPLRPVEGRLVADPPACDPARPMWRLYSIAEVTRNRVVSDCRNYYSWPSMRTLLLATGVAAVLANTRIDTDFRDWYVGDVRGISSNHYADLWRDIGNGYLTIPAMVGLAFVGECFEDYRPAAVLGEFGDRCWRACVVGAPPMIFMQYLLGGDRPGDGHIYSHWDPFENSHGVSGHAFMGAIPFITAAKMTQNPWAKAALYACSTMTGWSRINDDLHYLSQVWLGWWMAYLACSAVDQTNEADRHFSVAPLVSPELSGIGITYQR